MKKIDFFKKALRAEAHHNLSWIISAFSISVPGKEYFDYQVIHFPTGVFFNNVGGSLVRIDDAVINEPLFSFADEILASPEDCANLTEPKRTKLGQLLFNSLCLVNAFGKKYPYFEGRADISNIENVIAPRLKDTPKPGEERDPRFFYVDEYIKFVDSLTYLTGFSQLCVWSTTAKNIVAAPGIREFKKQLIEKYGDSLSDPVELAKFEAELKKFDEEYLKDDPANGRFLGGKAKDIARKKLFLTIGAGDGFEETSKVVPILNSLEEGWPTTPVELTAMMNTVRSASYSRGMETVKGGVSSKVLLRSAGNFKIKDTDCGTELGIRRNMPKLIINQLVGRYVKSSSGWTLIENLETANQYIDKDIIVRSPMYCKLDGDNICNCCAGENLAKNPLGISMALTDISAIIITTSLKKMHGTVLSYAKMDVKSSLS